MKAGKIPRNLKKSPDTVTWDKTAAISKKCEISFSK